MFKRRLPMDEVRRRRGEGQTMTQIARDLGFSKQAVSQALADEREKKGVPMIPGSLPAPMSGSRPKESEGIRELKRVINPTFRTIKTLDTECRKMEAAGQITSNNYKNLNFQRLKYIGEGRKLLGLALLIDEKSYEFSEVIRFQDYVLQVIGEQSDEAKAAIEHNLRSRRVLRHSLNPR